MKFTYKKYQHDRYFKTDRIGNTYPFESVSKDRCDNQDCVKDPRYIDSDNFLVENQTILQIEIYVTGGYDIAHYCQDCIEKLWDNVNKALNPKFRAFH